MKINNFKGIFIKFKTLKIIKYIQSERQKKFEY